MTSYKGLILTHYRLAETSDGQLACKMMGYSRDSFHRFKDVSLRRHPT